MSKNSPAIEKCDQRMANYSSEKREELDDAYEAFIATPLSKKDEALTRINDYLISEGWRLLNDVDWRDFNFCQYLDPDTGQSHRTDFAFVVQTERDIYKGLENMKEHVKRNKEFNIKALKK